MSHYSNSPYWRAYNSRNMTEDTEYENNLEKWNPNKTYYADSTITYNGKVYEAKWWTKGDIPNEKVANPWETPWKLIK